MKKVLIGYSGLVGSSLNHNKFDLLINRKNISEFTNTNPEVSELYISAGDARKWMAKKDENKFRSDSEELIKKIVKINAKKVILFSTIDVYDGQLEVTEKDIPNPIHPYGKVSLEKENQILNSFSNVRIIRLPGLFSKNLSKNFIFDLLNNREEYIYNQNLNSTYQYFDLSRLESFMVDFKKNKSNIINLVTEPISIYDIISACKSSFFVESNFNKSNLLNYDVRSVNFSNGYHLNRNEVLNDLNLFFKNYAK